MPNIFKHLARGRFEPYIFPEAKEIVLPTHKPDPVVPPEDELADQESQEQQEKQGSEKPSAAKTVIDYAQLQADAILQEANQKAEEILARARIVAEREIEELKAEAKTQGYRDGFQEGTQQALAEGTARLEQDAQAQGAAVQQFLNRAEAALKQQLDENVTQLRDLALAVAEKVVCVSLKSSAEVIGRMIQTAVDKRKRCEWVRIYIAECDAKRMASVPPSLTAALSALSDRVRIIPMADDESGTCIIEMPNEIVDASASTQLNNIRGLLSDTPAGGNDGGFLF